MTGLPTDGLAESVTRLDPRRLHEDSAADLFIAAAVPGVRAHLFHGSGAEADECTLWLLEPGEQGAWASVDYAPGKDEFLVQQHGARRLSNETERAYLRWLGLGRPDRERFGLTISPAGRQVWIDSAERTLTPYDG